MRELVSLSVSPWSERARWALEHHGLEYRLQQYIPMLGELPLRARLRRFTGRVTVPVLFTDEGALTESTAIARYADRVGSGATLLDPAHESRILELVAQTDRSHEAGRHLLTLRLAQSKAARAETLPPALRNSAVGDVMARSGVAFFMRKYTLAKRSASDDLRAFTGGLDVLREVLGGRDTILPSFSYADVVMSGLLQMVSPVDNRYLRLKPATRTLWTSPELAARYSDLVQWRDALYAKHRPAAARSAR